MKFTYLLISVMFSFLLFACGSTAKKEAKTSTSTSTSTPASTPAKTSTAGTYETVVLKGDIASPKKEMKGMLGDIKINIVYGSPSVKGREVWGGLVPYGKVWRTGANEATTIEFSKDVQVEGKSLAAGKYGLFAIANADQWTIIFNKTHDQWGAYEYDESKDALRVNVTPKKGMADSETMEFALEGSDVVLKWEKKAVAFQVK